MTRRSWGIRCVASHCESRRLSSTWSLHGVASWLHALVTQTIATGCVGTWASPEGTCGGPACVLGPGVHLRDCGPFSQTRILHTGLFSVCLSGLGELSLTCLTQSWGLLCSWGIPVCPYNAFCALLRAVALGTLGQR